MVGRGIASPAAIARPRWQIKRAPGALAAERWPWHNSGTVKCSIKGCDRPAVAHGLCQPHYMRKRRGGKLDSPVRKAGADDATEQVHTRVAPWVRERLEAEAKRIGATMYEAARGVLERWAKRN